MSRWLGAFALFGVAFALRAMVWPTVFVDGQILVVSNDAYYHFRRILYACAHFPETVRFDPFLNFPDGAEAIWPSFFDVAAAAVVLLLGGGSASDVERIAIWIPPVLGALTVAGVFLWVARHWGAAGGALGALLLALTPAHLWYSQLTFVDHHVAVALVAVALFATTIALATALASDEDARREIPLALGVGALATLGMHVWTGFLLHLGVLLMPAGVALALAAERRSAVRIARALAIAAAVPLLLVAPFGIGREWAQTSAGPFTPIAFSNFHPWFFGTLTAFALACTLAWRGPLGESRARRITSALGIGLGCLGLALPIVASVSGSLADSLGFLFKSQPSLSRVAEATTILRYGGRDAPSLGAALPFATNAFLFGPLLAAFLLARARNRAERVRAGLLVWLVLAWLGNALLQARFANSLAVVNALAFGAAVGVTWEALRTRGMGPPLRAVAAALALGVLVWPALPLLQRGAAPALRALRGEPTPVPLRLRGRLLALQTGHWLAANTPAVEGYLDASQTPEYGVFADPNLGHMLLWSAERPAMVGAFADYAGRENFELAVAYRELHEPEAWQRLEMRRIRYVVVEGIRPDGPARAMGRLLRLDPQALAGPGGRDRAALERHRLVHASAALDPAKQNGPPHFRVFERVSGAEVSGRAPAGERVELRLELRDARGALYLHRTTAVADERDRYRVRVPYVAPGAQGSIEAPAAYEVRCGDERHALEIGEADVREGRAIAGPACD